MASLKEVKGRISSINGTLKIKFHQRYAENHFSDEDGSLC